MERRRGNVPRTVRTVPFIAGQRDVLKDTGVDHAIKPHARDFHC